MSYLGRCNVHLSKERGFCARPLGHKDEHSKFPDNQGALPHSSLSRVRNKISAVQAELAELQALKDKYERNRRVICMGVTAGAKNGCGTDLRVKDLTYIQTFWYTPPYSCSGGDYWNLGEGQFICPKCGTVNRLYERPQVEALKHFFKNIEEAK